MICVEALNVYPESVTLKVGTWYYSAQAVVFPAYADCTTVEWYSDNENVATVNPSSGYIYAKNPGTAKVYAHTTDGSDIRQYITVTVQDKIYVNSVELCPASISVAKGDCVDLAATVLPENATNRALEWTSSNSSVSGVYLGTVCGFEEGTATITATATDGSGKSATCQVTVTSAVLVETVTVTPATKTLEYGKADFLHATVCPENALNRTVEWTSSNPDIVVVSPTEGIIYGKGEGTATVYATATDGSGVRGSCVVTVPRLVPVYLVEVCPEEQTMTIGEEKQLDFDIYPANATNKMLQWNSSNTNVATVTAQSGYVKAIAEGETIITATAANGVVSNECKLSVKKPSITIQQNGLKNEIIFDQTGKKWICIEDEYVFFDSSSASEEERQKYRTYGEYCMDNLYDADALKITREEMNGLVFPSKEYLRTYEDEELRILFALDPHGVAAYVHLYAKHMYSTLEEQEAYKDSMFRILYKRNPRHYTRRVDNGYWYIETNWQDKDIQTVLSESDFIFGLRPIWDKSVLFVFIKSLLESALDLILDWAQIGNILFFVEFINDIVLKNNITTAVSQELLGELLDTLEKKVSKVILTVFNVAALAGASAFEEALRLADYEKKVYLYCLDNCKYDVYIKNLNGEIARLDSIRGALE